jgi:flagellar biosynthetic protein FliQ
MDIAPVDLVRQAIMVALIIATPVLLVALAVGVVMALLQAATQVQDQAMSTVPKLLACGLVLVVLATWMVARVVVFAVEMFGGGG